MSSDKKASKLEQVEVAVSEGFESSALPTAALRALAEAALRHKKRHRALSGKGPETAERGGPKGDEPTRYGDWERGGRAVDF